MFLLIRSHRLFFTLAMLLLAAWLASPMPALGEEPIYSDRDRIHPVFARHGMVATQEALATEVGIDILRQGGNAIDAGVAVGFALAVTLPRAGNLGGGGFMLIHSAKTGEAVALDFRETAPSAAGRDMYLDDKNEVDEQRLRYSYQSAAVPGTVAGLTLALERYGHLPLRQVIAPAIRLAEQGFPVSEDLAATLQEARERLSHWPESLKIFFKAGGIPYQPGDLLIQRDLAQSLKAIADQGARAFYDGVIAEKIAADMKANGGLITMADLKNYRPLIRQPVKGSYRGYEILSMPPPSSGGVHLIQILNILEHFPIGELGHNGAATLHLMAEAMKYAYADRSQYLGDPAFVQVPVEGLIAKGYAAELAKRIDPHRPRPATEIEPGDPLAYESDQTTHFSVMDGAGNIVSCTYTLNFSYGSGITAAGTGILLNNEMDDFSAKPGVPNAYGLIGGDANAIEPGKRPLSSMTPTIVLKDGKPFLATGSPGGPRIITTVLQILMNVIDHGLNIAAATLAPRIHHQWLPDELRVEQGLSPDTIRLLEGMGHRVVVLDSMGSTQSIVAMPWGYYGYSDSRRRGALCAGLP